MIILNDNNLNGLQIGATTFNCVPILSGQFKGKFAADECLLNEFSEIFKEIDYEIVDLEQINFVNTYSSQPEINQYRLIDVTDLYNKTININLFNNLNLTTFIINRPYIDGTWTDEDVVFYVNQLNEEAKLP
jgi:hypothetical protein